MSSRRDDEFTDYVSTGLMPLQRVAYLLCQDRQRAEDLVQATITKLYVHWTRARAADHFDAYVRAILVREFLAERRSGWARRVTLTGQGHPAPAGSATYGTTLYVGGGCSNGVTPVSVAAGKARKPIYAGPAIDKMVATPNGKTIYAASANSTVAPISTAIHRAGKPIETGLGATPSIAGMAVTPNGRTVYVLATGSPGTVTPISTATNTASMPIQIGRDGTDLQGTSPIAVTPDGKTVYVVNDKAGEPITTMGKNARAIAVTPDGRTGYVANGGSNTVTPFSTVRNTAGQPIKAGGCPITLLIRP
jgi:DNA-binding beta-propeller fold protein YncE